MSIWGLIVCPILSFPFILYGIYKQDKNSLYLMAFFLGIVAFLTPPVTDLYRHTLDYFYYQSLPWKNFIETIDEDVITQIISYSFAHFGINYAFVRLVFVTISLSIYFYIFYNLLLEKKISRKIYFILWIVLLAGYNYFELVLGVRYGLATAFFIGAFYFLYLKKKILKSLIFIMLSSFTHFFLFPISILMFLFYYIPISINKRCFLILSGISLGIGFVLATNFILTYYNQQTAYIDGQYGVEYTSNVSFKGLIYYYLKRLWIIPLFYFFIRDKSNYTQMRNIIYILILMFISVISLSVISGRIITIISILLILYFLLNYKKQDRYMFNIILLSSILFFSANIYTYRFVLGNNPYLGLCKPLILLLDNDIYSKSWVYENINQDGFFK